MKKLFFGLFLFSLILSISFVLADNNSTIGSNGTITCTDSDSGLNYYVRGETTEGGDVISVDTCQGDKLIENYCDGNNGKYIEYDCPTGCIDGACTQETLPGPSNTIICTDSDGGTNYYQRGKVVVTENGEIISSKEDYCDGNINGINKLREYVCSGDSIIEGDYLCSNGCKYGACIGTTTEGMKELVKCVFANSEKEEKCYSDDSKFSCSGKETCVAEISGVKGKKLTWKSSCGGYDYTVIDGENEYAEFECGGEKSETEEAKISGYRYAYWKCQNGEKFKSEDDTSCKLPETWELYAKEFCDEKCNAENGKCGTAHYSISNECALSFDSGGKEIIKEIKKEYKKEIKESEIKEGISLCKNSCPLDDKCYPFGYRKAGEYCSDKGGFVVQLEAEAQCENNFECGSNVCVSGQCIDEGLMNKILNWFKRLFGDE